MSNDERPVPTQPLRSPQTSSAARSPAQLPPDRATTPNTAVAADPGQLRAVPDAEPEQQAAFSLAPAEPNIARMYNYWLGGKDHHVADREAAAGVLADYPAIAHLARANRAFTGRAVRHVTAAGISQFIDVGPGLPAPSSVHTTAQYLNRAARVAYVDNDPVVLAHARALAAGPGVGVIVGDLRDPAAILANPDLHRVVDLSAPACLLLASVLHFLEPAEADSAVATLAGGLAPGSFLVISAGTATGTSPAVIDRLRAAYQGSVTVAGRTCDEITAWFTGLDLLPPGLVDVHAWRPDGLWNWPSKAGARIVGGVARKPGRSDGDTIADVRAASAHWTDRDRA